MRELSLEECNKLLENYQIDEIKECECIDSSHDEDDIRQNYILDKKYVLRINNANVFEENRFIELNRLIERYKEFGIEAPRFLRKKDGKFLGKIEGASYYLSEYLEGQIPPEDLSREKENILVEERLKLIASFAEKYKGVDLSDTMSMYSLFELSPYDILEGIDEKQANLNNLTQKLDELGEEGLASQIRKYDRDLRQELLKCYKSLPRCVFQGDENFGNMIVDEDYRIKGLFDFNMAGTDVIVNYFANNALLIPSVLREDEFVNLTTDQVLERLRKDFKRNTDILKKYYNFSEIEKAAYELYAKIALLLIYPNECTMEYWLDDSKEKKKILSIMKTLISVRIFESV